MTMTTEQTGFFVACEDCAKAAAKEGKKFFVKRDGNGFAVSGNISKDWLFTAYPGGRKVLSVAGKEIAGL